MTQKPEKLLIDFDKLNYFYVLEHYRELYENVLTRPLVNMVMPYYNGKHWYEERNEMLKEQEARIKFDNELFEAMLNWYKKDRRCLW